MSQTNVELGPLCGMCAFCKTRIYQEDLVPSADEIPDAMLGIVPRRRGDVNPCLMVCCASREDCEEARCALDVPPNPIGLPLRSIFFFMTVRYHGDKAKMDEVLSRLTSTMCSVEEDRTGEKANNSFEQKGEEEHEVSQEEATLVPHGSDAQEEKGEDVRSADAVRKEDKEKYEQLGEQENEVSQEEATLVPQEHENEGSQEEATLVQESEGDAQKENGEEMGAADAVIVESPQMSSQEEGKADELVQVVDAKEDSAVNRMLDDDIAAGMVDKEEDDRQACTSDTLLQWVYEGSHVDKHGLQSMAAGGAALDDVFGDVIVHNLAEKGNKLVISKGTSKELVERTAGHVQMKFLEPEESEVVASGPKDTIAQYINIEEQAEEQVKKVHKVQQSNDLQAASKKSKGWHDEQSKVSVWMHCTITHAYCMTSVNLLPAVLCMQLLIAALNTTDPEHLCWGFQQVQYQQKCLPLLQGVMAPKGFRSAKLVLAQPVQQEVMSSPENIHNAGVVVMSKMMELLPACDNSAAVTRERKKESSKYELYLPHESVAVECDDKRGLCVIGVEMTPANVLMPVVFCCMLDLNISDTGAHLHIVADVVLVMGAIV